MARTRPPTKPVSRRSPSRALRFVRGCTRTRERSAAGGHHAATEGAEHLMEEGGHGSIHSNPIHDPRVLITLPRALPPLCRCTFCAMRGLSGLSLSSGLRGCSAHTGRIDMVLGAIMFYLRSCTFHLRVTLAMKALVGSEEPRAMLVP